MDLGAVHISRDTLWGEGGSAILSHSYLFATVGEVMDLDHTGVDIPFYFISEDKFFNLQKSVFS